MCPDRSTDNKTDTIIFVHSSTKVSKKYLRTISEDMPRLHLGWHETPLGSLVGREYASCSDNKTCVLPLTNTSFSEHL